MEAIAERSQLFKRRICGDVCCTATKVIGDGADDGVVCGRAVTRQSRKQHLLLGPEVLMAFLFPEPERQASRAAAAVASVARLSCCATTNP